MNPRQRQIEWEKRVNWAVIGPKLIAALEDIDFALHCAGRPTYQAKKIVDRIFKEIGMDELDRDLPD
jgi:hypothetical protein